MSVAPETIETASAPPLPTLGVLQSRWSPSSVGGAVPTHTGAASLPDAVFIAAPPTDEIGDLLSAHTTVREKGGALWLWNRLQMGAAGGGLCLVLFAVGTHMFFGVTPAAPFLIAFALLGGVPAFWFGAPPNTTSYVGTRGAARFVWGGRNHPIKSAQTLSFARVSGSLVRQTRHYTNGVYGGTDYAFIWGHRDEAGKVQPQFNISGRFYRSAGPRANDEMFHFGAAVERAYTLYRMSQLRGVLANGGSEPFSVGTTGKLVVSAAGLQVALVGKNEFIPRENIAGLSINQGIITITRTGAKRGILGIGSEGVFTVAYAELASPRLFLALLAHVVGQSAPEEGTAGREALPRGGG